MTAFSIDPVGSEAKVRRYLVEERMLEGFRQREPLRGLVIEHALNQVEKEDVVFLVRHLVALQWFTVFTNIAAGRALLVPI